MSENSSDAQNETIPSADEAKQQQSMNHNGGRRRRPLIILVVVLIIGAMIGSWFWYQNQIKISTDDAFITSRIHSISARVPGHVEQIHVEDNQIVHQGDLLVQLDPDNYRAKVDKARAVLMQAENKTSGDYAQVNAAEATLRQVEARYEQTRLDLERGEALLAREVIPKQQLEQLRTAVKVAQGQVKEAAEKLKQARALAGISQKGNKDPLIAQRKAELLQAEQELTYTRITAPTAGYVTRKSVELGNNLQPGQTLMSLVELENPWVIANYKESQLSYIRPGQKVEFSVDAYPDLVFTGFVDSIMAGTGSAFSLLPPENATGNYVKVVQRVPVKLLIDVNPEVEEKLRVGMSVVPTIMTGRTFKDVLSTLNPFN